MKKRPHVSTLPVPRDCGVCGRVIAATQDLVRGPHVRESWHVDCAPPWERGERRRFYEAGPTPADRVAVSRL